VEQNRVTHQAKVANLNNQFNQALNSGNLDEAARLQSTMTATQQQLSIDNQRLAIQYPGC
jgi:hypothetical protein